ncbi:biotin-requiring enzyme [Xylariales sp. PMI_506]|nr:biotin-requiring enzyme [Xylariales sp. PMI_506]
MASLATACRLSARLASRRVTSDAAVRGFRTCAASRAAQNFLMPALSPTMTEGNIASWKVKEGDSYSAGDVLLEIETDKATMDVEAQDDGIMVKIMQGDGSKGVQVGTRIGVMAETGDDISSLEIPAESMSVQSEAKQEAAPSQSTETAPKSTQRKPSGGPKAPPQKYPLYPSVEHLIKEHKLDESVISEITPTGPQGRLLKGDVLAYLGAISPDRPAEVSKRFDHNAHLDLSNIKIAAPKTPSKSEQPAKPSAPPVPENLQISLPISLDSVVEVQKKIDTSLGTFMPLSTFVARAAEVANDELPLPANYKPKADELFDQVLGLKAAKKFSQGFYQPQLTALPPSSSAAAPKSKSAKSDIIDLLAKSAKPRAQKPAKSLETAGISTVANTYFSVTVPKSEEQRAEVFLTRMKMVLENEPGRLVL